jgi:hypothetical protein
MHDPRVGRFFAVDPLFKSFPWNSHYAFSENRIIDGVELEGLEVSPNDILRAKFMPSEAKPKLLQIYDGSILAVISAVEGVVWTAQNPKEALKGTGNFLLGLSTYWSPTSIHAQGQQRFLDQKFGTSTEATMAAFQTSLHDGYKKLVYGNLQEKSEVITGVLIAVVSEKGVSHVLQVGKLTLMSKLPNGGKLLKYMAGEHKYLYTVDKSGNLVRAQTDNLKFKTHNGRLAHDPNTPGKLSGDHAGHLFADLFGGDPTLKNLVSQASNVNQKIFRTIERVWEQALKDGKKVEVDIKINYDNASMPQRPSSFEITYKIDGKINNAIIENINPKN